MTDDQKLVQAFYECRDLQIGSKRVIGDDTTALLKLGDSIVATFDSEFSQYVVVTGDGINSETLRRLLDEVAKKFGASVTRFGPQWLVNGIEWDGSQFNIPEDLTPDWIGQTLGREIGEAVRRINAGEIIKGDQRTIESACKLTKAPQGYSEGEWMAGTAEAFLGSVYTAHSLLSAFINMNWNTQRAAISQYYDLTNMPNLASPIAVNANGSITCTHSSGSFVAHLRPEYFNRDLTRLAHSL